MASDANEAAKFDQEAYVNGLEIDERITALDHVIAEQATRIEQLETGLWDVHAYCNNWDWFIWMWPIRRIKRIVKAALENKHD